jgi:hypothetical protein
VSASHPQLTEAQRALLTYLDRCEHSTVRRAAQALHPLRGRHGDAYVERVAATLLDLRFITRRGRSQMEITVVGRQFAAKWLEVPTSTPDAASVLQATAANVTRVLSEAGVAVDGDRAGLRARISVDLYNIVYVEYHLPSGAARPSSTDIDRWYEVAGPALAARGLTLTRDAGDDVGNGRVTPAGKEN